MRIRKSHAIRDRIELILILLLLAMVMGYLAKAVYNHRQEWKTATIEDLLETAMQPVGSTMYIWGDGWDGEDRAAGATATQIGMSPQWKRFAKMQNEAYDFEEHRFERDNGLDCSGFVGWVLYNTFEKESGLAGYVTLSTDMAESLASKGWGTLIKNPKKFLPGDIVSMKGHVWICLGTCEDGSVLLVHSSPPGVSVCGTAHDKTNANSVAVQLATEYMRNTCPEWQEKYPNRGVSISYLEEVSLFRWNESVMLDAKKIQEQSAEEIMGILSPAM